MKEHPILFSAPMVRAILAGKKTQTRRIIKFPKNWDGGTIYGNKPFGLKYEDSDGLVHRIAQKWQPGDRMWVRETWAEICYNEMGCDGLECLEHGYEYRADKPAAKYAGGWGDGFDSSEVPPGCKWRPSIFMPRVASRLLLEITDVRFERLLDISEADAISEGVEQWRDGNYIGYCKHASKYRHAVDSFLSLWDSIHRNESSHNHFVWVITFKKLDT